jgi:hypothetical protein|tara:strand:- start:109 stop:504 length:396 start_codon:yes stop_codon:yes gene_type:complete
MNKISKLVVSFFLIGSVFFIFSCEKADTVDTITSNDGVQARLAYTEKGYTEIEVNPIVKTSCYFAQWDKTIMTPVSGLFEYYDENNNWVASIDFGDGTCDEWATKSWDVNIFPDYPSGSEDFSVFDYKSKK